MITYFENMLHIIDKSIHSIDGEKFEKLISQCVDTLKAGNKIVASGLGKNVPICEKFVGTMLSMGLSATFLHTNSAVHGDMGAVRDNDLVILLTKSGATKESVYLEELLSKRNCIQWLLSFEKEGILAKKMENSLILDLEHEGDDWNIVPNNSTTMNLIVLQGLAIELGRRMGVTLEQFKVNHPGGHIGEILQ